MQIEKIREIKMKMVKDSDQVKKKKGIKLNKKWFTGSRQSRTKCNLTNKRRFWKFKFKNPSVLILANMQLNTGDYESAIVRVQGKSFILYGKRYLVDDEKLYFNRTFKMWCLNYHEDLSIPVKKTHAFLPVDENIPAQEIKKELESTKIDVVNNINPKVLQDFTTSEVIQKVFQGQEMEGLFHFLKIMMILNLVASAGAIVLLFMR